jgi:hypothetical protein
MHGVTGFIESAALLVFAAFVLVTIEVVPVSETGA